MRLWSLLHGLSETAGWYGHLADLLLDGVPGITVIDDLDDVTVLDTVEIWTFP